MVYLLYLCLTKSELGKKCLRCISKTRSLYQNLKLLLLFPMKNLLKATY